MSDLLTPDELEAVRKLHTERRCGNDCPAVKLLAHVAAQDTELAEYRKAGVRVQGQWVKRVQIADAETDSLRAALVEQWEAAHAEHCRDEWPHEGHCTWPQPPVLEARNDR